ncbi:MAG: hypothetical protein WB680_23150 [Candidatus Acidiferrales bacterium]
MGTMFIGNGYTIEFLGIQPRPVPTGDTPPQNPDSIHFGPAAQVTMEKSGATTTLFWPWSWGSDNGFQGVMSMAKAFADKQIEVAGL